KLIIKRGRGMSKWLPELEGLRGFASLWVFIGHICILSQFHVPILGSPSYGVDLFIILSGFLMTKNYVERQDAEPWYNIRTVFNFMFRRFFRIAPLYYVLLLIAIYFGPALGELREIIGQSDLITRTNINKYNDQSMFNFLVHISLLFGISPSYSANTALPDWSISLEFQYYILFPFIMMLVGRLGEKLVLPVITILCVSGYYIFSAFYSSFELPSFILLKLPVFISGMFIYIATIKKNVLSLSLALFSLIVNSITSLHINTVQLCVQIIMVLFVFYISICVEKKEGAILIIRKLLTNKISLWIGDVSYSVYLIHLLVILPVLAFLIQDYELLNTSPFIRFSLVAIICVPIVYSL
ncbi:TPA: acyltransferase, partial [Klebsiella pneumoniae]|nr:acyltransferase [Klebsiella pneumoniae]